ncbi:MAG TPA: divalent-cation tolerance protein CutA [Alphaproteobacteria bacterium]|nr:divalent-cation tolerance protein CutA [Alphaproteobacteria bacterium]
MAEPVLLYVTCADDAEARRIARALVDERLIACANVLAPHTAVYRWEGEVEEGPEVGMLMKTTAALTARVSERVKALHSYTLPCVVELPIRGGNPDFLDWIGSEVA